MEAHKLRVLIERRDLSAKYNRLCAFIADTNKFWKVEVNEAGRLRSQVRLMGEYLEVLQERINHFDISDDEMADTLRKLERSDTQLLDFVDAHLKREDGLMTGPPGQPMTPSGMVAWIVMAAPTYQTVRDALNGMMDAYAARQQ